VSILLLNAGSSSLKAALMDPATESELVNGLADWAGDVTHYKFAGPDGAKRSADVTWKGHAEAVRRFISDLTPEQRAALTAVGHRIVHGGSFTTSVRITPEIRSRITELVELAPLHNPPSLEALAAAQEELPDLPHVAVFDTTFHVTLPPEAYTYPVPWKWTCDWGIRRYGFHGLSHAYCAGRATELLSAPPFVPPSQGGKQRGGDPKLVICHLGHGCSACAVRAGRSIDTSMGFTPLEGLMMGTRSGSIDPSIVCYVEQQHGLTATQVESALNRESGLLGVSSVSADMREVLKAAKDENEQARLALAIYGHRVRQAIGALAVTLGGIDALVFTAGVGENAAEVRASICAGLECLGLELDPQANNACRPDADIATKNSRARILVIATREDLTMLHEVVRTLGQ
jgi:acetate kinase